MPDDTFVNKDDIWAQNADDGWAGVFSVVTKAGVITPSGAFTRLLTGMRTKTGAITPSGASSKIWTPLRRQTASVTPSGIPTRYLVLQRTKLGYI